MKSARQYDTYRKPLWAPPAWIFGPVWTFLYILVAVSFCYEVFLYSQHQIPPFVLIALVVNILCNAAYTPLQFYFRNFALALLDIFFVLGTLVWALMAIFPYASWISYLNLPYVVWVCFATVLQVSVTVLNRKSHR